MISTVGEYVPDSAVRDLLAESRGVKLVGRGDEREADYMKKIGFEEIGCGRKYETFVFKVGEQRCDNPECGCKMPVPLEWSELEGSGANQAGEAAQNHMDACRRYANRKGGKGK